MTDYERVSGQKINFEKSEMCFGEKVDNNVKLELQNIFGIKIVECNILVFRFVRVGKRMSFSSMSRKECGAN